MRLALPIQMQRTRPREPRQASVYSVESCGFKRPTCVESARSVTFQRFSSRKYEVNTRGKVERRTFFFLGKKTAALINFVYSLFFLRLYHYTKRQRQMNRIDVSRKKKKISVKNISDIICNLSHTPVGCPTNLLYNARVIVV